MYESYKTQKLPERYVNSTTITRKQRESIHLTNEFAIESIKLFISLDIEHYTVSSASMKRQIVKCLINTNHAKYYYTLVQDIGIPRILIPQELRVTGCLYSYVFCAFEYC
jgi:hypothetical protein